MKMTPQEIYENRKRFFNDHADQWIDMWYRDANTGRYDKHARDFERLFSLLPLKPGDHILDAGCGTGVLVPFITERITDRGMLYELDYAEQMIAINRRLHKDGNIRFIVSDVGNAPLDDTVCDVVVCFSCFPHFQDKDKTVKAMARVLKPNGLLAVSHFDSSEGINKHHENCHAVMHDHLPDEVTMRALLEKAGFAVREFIDEPGFYFILAAKQLGPTPLRAGPLE
jgi:demethylmenaquinone methyltransferase/2-methoxy-6-polyprenyl-1,4-benzoquinol methylase